MLTLSSPQLVQEKVQQWKQEGHSVVLVPTMGNLHEGHLALVDKAKEAGTKTVVSIFVNPKQFGPHEDYKAYPRTLEADERKLRALGVDLLFAPTVEDLYPKGFATKVAVGELASNLCGRSRPGHFEGVATVCLKLFQISLADVAVFGRKDFQQLRVIEQMCADLNLPIRILSHETVRETDGLAMSSRNAFLNPEERQVAGRIPQAIRAVKAVIESNDGVTVETVRETAKEALGNGLLDLDYCEITSSKDLVPCTDSVSLDSIGAPRLFLAVRVGNTRLIDNATLRTLH